MMNEEFPYDFFLGSAKKESNLNNLPPSSKDFLKTNADARSVNSDFDLERNNEKLHHYLKEEISDKKYDAFFKKTFSLSHIDSNQIEISVTSDFIKSMIQLHYMETLESAVNSLFGQPKEIKIIVSQNPQSLSSNDQNILKSTAPNNKVRSVNENKFTIDLNQSQDDLLSKVESQYINHMNPDNRGILIDLNKKFTNFIIGPSNNMASATARAVAQSPGKNGKYPSLYMYSDSGLGKTHLLHAVANEIKDRHPQLVITLITARDFMNEMITAIQNNQTQNFRKYYSEKVDVLMIDDIHELQNKKGTQDEFFHVFNELHNKGKQLIFTSDKAPKEIDGIEERIKTRLQWGLVVDIQRPDLETRIAILKRKANDLDLFCPDDVINLIACSVKSSIRELEGSLMKLSAYSEVMKIPIDCEIAKEQLNLADQEESKIITLESIAKVTGQFFKIPIVDLKSKSRNKKIARARHISIYLSRKLLKTTQQDIGKFYGGRDHTSIIHAVNKIKDQLKTDTSLSKDVIQIENAL